MSKLKKMSLLLFTSIALTILLVFNVNKLSLTASAQTGRNVIPYTAQDIIDEAPDPAASEEQARVQAKRRRYDESNIRRGSNGLRDLTQLPDNVGVSAINETLPPAPIPVEPNTVVLIGTIDKVQPYLTEQKTQLFTEFSMKVESVLKGSEPGVPNLGGSIVFDSIGGAIRLRNGKVIRYEANNGVKFPRAGKRYLLFLEPSNNGQDLSMRNGYELYNGKVFALRETLVYKPGRGGISKVSPFSGMSESEFLQQVVQIIANPVTKIIGGIQ